MMGSVVRSVISAAVVAAMLAVTGPARADARDPATARALLKEGYELSRASRCDEAISLFLRSVELDPQPRTYLNLARCEEQTGRFSDALTHWVLARDLARDRGLRVVIEEAESRLSSLELRMPHVVVALAPAATSGSDAGQRAARPANAPTSITVMRDGVHVPAEVLGRPLPVDPGRHLVVVEAEGHEPRAYPFEIAEGQRLDLTVEPGEAVAPAVVAVAAEPPVARPTLPPPSVQPPVERGRQGASRSLVWSGLGLAAVGLATGAVAGLLTLSESSRLRSACPGGECPPDVMSDVESARRLGTVSTVAFSAAAVGAAVVAVGLLLRPRAPAAPRAAGGLANAWVAPASGGALTRLSF